jgi:allophanate hydrolase subunit 1
MRKVNDTIQLIQGGIYMIAALGFVVGVIKLIWDIIH